MLGSNASALIAREVPRLARQMLEEYGESYPTKVNQHQVRANKQANQIDVPLGLCATAATTLFDDRNPKSNRNRRP
jgi:hypothetical protein